MSWLFEQRTGRLYYSDGRPFVKGYSGKGEGKNNPDMQQVHNVGPIPVGDYTMTEVHASKPGETTPHGPFVIVLVPDATNEMFGRDDFRVHGDKKDAPGTASEGCVIAPRPNREAMWASDDHRFRVVADLAPVDMETV